MSLQGAIEWVQDQALTVSGVGAAPDNPDLLAGSSTLFVIAYPASGEIIIRAAGFGHDLDTIRVLILTYRADLNQAMQRLEGFPHSIARKVQADLTLGGNVATFENMNYQFIVTEWNSIQVVGYQLDINRVKALTTH
jgi:hypothetical protein